MKTVLNRLILISLIAIPSIYLVMNQQYEAAIKTDEAAIKTVISSKPLRRRI